MSFEQEIIRRLTRLERLYERTAAVEKPLPSSSAMAHARLHDVLSAADHFIAGQVAGEIFVATAANAFDIIPFDWDVISAAPAADMVHDHSNAAEGGSLETTLNLIYLRLDTTNDPLTNPLEILSTTANQLKLSYDALNYFTIDVADDAVVTFSTEGNNYSFDKEIDEPNKTLYQKYKLLRYYAQAGKIVAEEANEKLIIAFMGDSWVERDVIPGFLRTELQQRYGDGGAGYVGIGDNAGAPTDQGVTYSRVGVWTDYNDSTVRVGNGVDISEANTTDVATPASVQIVATFNYYTIHYLQQVNGGTFTYEIDGGGTTPVNTAGAESYQTVAVGPISTAEHTLDIVVTVAGAAGVTLFGVDIQKRGHGDAYNGCVVHRCGEGGSDSREWASADATIWSDAYTALNPDVVLILLGTNDKYAAVPITPAAFYGYMETIVDRLQAALPYADIVLLTPTDNTHAGTATIQYVEQIRQLAIDQGITCIDMYKLLGDATVATAAPYSLFDDAVHLNDAGSALYANQLVNELEWASSYRYRHFAIGEGSQNEELFNKSAFLAIDTIGFVCGSAYTDSTTKFGRYGGMHYLNSEEPVNIFHASCSGTNNIVNLGGGSATLNAATQIRMYTAPNYTYLTGIERCRLTDTEMVINDISDDYDFRIESNGDANNFFSDGGSDRIGIGTASPNNKLEIFSTSTPQFRIAYSGTGYVEITASSTGIITLDATGTNERFVFNDKVGIGTGTSVDRLLHVETADSDVDTITYNQRLTHSTDGTAAALFGVGVEYELEDSAGNMQVAATVETLWSVATSAAESPIYRIATRPKNISVGYSGAWTYSAITGTVTVIANGTGDVTKCITCMYAVWANSAGDYSGGVVTLGVSESNIIYNDGAGDTLTISVAADGSVTLVEAGGDNFYVSLWMTWL